MQAASPNGLPVIYVGRPTKWGNAFEGRFAVEKFRIAAEFMLKKQPDWLDELRGKNLACWCPLLDEPCHVDVLLELANREKE